MKNSLLFSLVALFISLNLVYNGCKDSGSEPSPPGSETVSTTISGSVFDQSNTPLAGVEVTSAGQTVITNSSGAFTFSGISVPKARYVVNAQKTGYFRGSYADAPAANGTSNIEIYLVTAGASEIISAAAGGTVQVNNGTGVEIVSNSVARGDGTSYTGNVNVNIAYLDPTSEDFSNIIPGGDMLAQTASNSQVSLYSYGIIKVEMKGDAGENLQIKSGSTSTVTVDIPPSMEGTAPSTIPLWYYDDATGLWREEGTAAKQGDKYIGTVTHFSDWNCDVPEGTATVKGLVIDCNNNPVPGITVKIGQATANTGSDGRFERRVPANTAFEVQVLGSKNFGLTSAAVPVPPLAEGAVHDVGTLAVDCPTYITGLLRCGSEKKYGQVVISWQGGYNAGFTDAEGRFSLAADIGKNAQISIYTLDNKYKLLEITTPAQRGDSLNLGPVEICEQVQTGENTITLDGSGFNNKTFNFSGDTLSVYGMYDPEDSLTIIWMYQVIPPDTITFWLTFTGNNLGQATEPFLYVAYNSKVWYGGESLTGSSAIINVTKYGGLGGLIEGNFNGTLLDLLGSSTSVSLTNGKFSVIRRIITSGDHKRINNISTEIKKKMFNKD